MFDGRLWIVTHRQKTNTKVMVPLLPPALKILNKYEGCYNDGQLMPIITNQKLRRRCRVSVFRSCPLAGGGQKVSVRAPSPSDGVIATIDDECSAARSS